MGKKNSAMFVNDMICQWQNFFPHISLLIIIGHENESKQISWSLLIANKMLHNEKTFQSTVSYDSSLKRYLCTL